MKVTVFPYREKVAHGNILWPGKFPARNGLFPANHPCAARTAVFRSNTSECGGGVGGAGTGLDVFRARGYWASCFPEGDGITWKPLKGQSDTQALADIRECFGWEAEWSPKVQVDA